MDRTRRGRCLGRTSTAALVLAVIVRASHCTAEERRQRNSFSDGELRALDMFTIPTCTRCSGVLERQASEEVLSQNQDRWNQLVERLRSGSLGSQLHKPHSSPVSASGFPTGHGLFLPELGNAGAHVMHGICFNFSLSSQPGRPIEVLPLVLDKSQLSQRASSSQTQDPGETDVENKLLHVRDALNLDVPLILGNTLWHSYPTESAGALNTALKAVIDTFLLLHSQYARNSSAPRKYIFDNLLIGNGCLAKRRYKPLSLDLATDDASAAYPSGLGNLPPPRKVPRGARFGDDVDGVEYLLHSLLAYDMIHYHDGVDSMDTHQQAPRRIGRRCGDARVEDAGTELVCFETVTVKGGSVGPLLQHGGSTTSRRLITTPPVASSPNNDLLEKLRAMVWKASSLVYPSVSEVVEQVHRDGLSVLVVGQAREEWHGKKDHNPYLLVENIKQVSEWLEEPGAKDMMLSSVRRDHEVWCGQTFMAIKTDVQVAFTPRLPKELTEQIAAVEKVDLLVVSAGTDLLRYAPPSKRKPLSLGSVLLTP
eukprot:scaffold7522_cov417-Prasinococcus_capsulatus_cf.AAC.3